MIKTSLDSFMDLLKQMPKKNIIGIKGKRKDLVRLMTSQDYNISM